MAASDYTRADFGALSTGESDYQRVYTELVSTIETLNGQLRSSLSEWVGAAQAAYHTAQAEWNAAMANMDAVLKNLQGVASQAATNYPMTEAANASLWS